MVLEAGRLVEFASPTTLLQQDGGVFRSMVNDSKDRDDLLRMAGL